MATKTKSTPISQATLLTRSSTELPRTPPATVEEYVLHIRVLGKRLEEHVDFMSAAEKLNGTSAEAKRKALAQFYSRLTVLEVELGRIKEETAAGLSVGPHSRRSRFGRGGQTSESR